MEGFEIDIYEILDWAAFSGDGGEKFKGLGGDLGIQAVFRGGGPKGICEVFWDDGGDWWEGLVGKSGVVGVETFD